MVPDPSSSILAKNSLTSILPPRCCTTRHRENLKSLKLTNAHQHDETKTFNNQTSDIKHHANLHHGSNFIGTKLPVAIGVELLEHGCEPGLVVLGHALRQSTRHGLLEPALALERRQVLGNA